MAQLITSPPESDLAPGMAATIESARAVLNQLLKGIKQIGLYRHAEQKYAEYLEKAYLALSEHLRQHGRLELRIEQTHFSVARTHVGGDEVALPYKLFKDGIRQIVFQPGFTLAELARFTLIVLSDPEHGADAINAQLWQEQLPHLEYIMVEGFHLDGHDEEAVQVEVDQVVTYLEQRLRANSHDYLRFARINEQDLEMTLDGVEQMRGLVIKGAHASAELKARLQQDLAADQSTRQFPKLVKAVFQVIDTSLDDSELLEDVLTHLLDAMLMQDDFATVNQVVSKLRSAVEQSPGDARLERLFEGFIHHMGEEARLSRLAANLKRLRPRNAIDLARYVSVLSHYATPALLGVLEQVELADNRIWLCELLIPFAKASPLPFVERLQAERPQTVRDMLYILDRSAHPDRVRFFATVFNSKNLALKLDVLGMIGKNRSSEARKILVICLDDPHAPMRSAAARALVDSDRVAAFNELLSRIKRDEFQTKGFEERQAFFQAVGSTGMPGALDFFASLANAKPGLFAFNKQRVNEDKVLAVYGLASMGNAAALEVLHQMQADPHVTAEVASAIRASLGRFKHLQQPQGPGHG
ncbi:MAG: HEAT repeat domain-containing protein [Myxococcaceae bacterium]|nr:HEAT repeat domain-containing protein [Myxococcaceae bacterium]